MVIVRNGQMKRGVAKRSGKLTQNEVFRGSEAHIVSEFVNYQRGFKSSP